MKVIRTTYKQISIKIALGDNNNGTIHIGSELDESKTIGINTMPTLEYYYINNARETLDFLLPNSSDY